MAEFSLVSLGWVVKWRLAPSFIHQALTNFSF